MKSGGEDEGLTLRVFKNQVIAASISNVVGVFVGHPLDTIKVRIQLQAGTSGMTVPEVVSATF